MKPKSGGDNSSESPDLGGRPAHSARGGGRKPKGAKLAAVLEGSEEQPVDVAGGNPSKRRKRGEEDNDEENAAAVDEDYYDEDEISRRIMGEVLGGRRDLCSPKSTSLRFRRG